MDFTKHTQFQLSCSIITSHNYLQRARLLIEDLSNVIQRSPYRLIGVRIGKHFNFITRANSTKIFLFNQSSHPNLGQVSHYRQWFGILLDITAYGHITFDHLPRNRRSHFQALSHAQRRFIDIEDLQRRFGLLELLSCHNRLIPGHFKLFLGSYAMVCQLLLATVIFLRQFIG